MVLSRAAFGVEGQKLPGVVSWLVSIGWETFLSILAVLATATIFDRLGWGGGTGTKVVATVVVASLIVAASVAGYHVIMRLQSWLTWITGIVSVLYIAMTLDDIDWSAVQALPSGSSQAVIGALVMVMTGFGLGWINISADWSRYQRRDASGAGHRVLEHPRRCPRPARPGGLRPGARGVLARDPRRRGRPTRSAPWPRCSRPGRCSRSCWRPCSRWSAGRCWASTPRGLTLLSLGVRLKRPQAAFVDGVILTLGTVYVVFVADNFINPFQSFLITLGVPLAAWAGIMIADIALRKRDYDDVALFDRAGRYGAFDWVSLGTLVVGSVIGWGLVVNTFSDDASWNNWQGYLLGPLGLGGKDGAWAYANLGVLAALVLGFAVTYVARRGTVSRQEAGPDRRP